MRTLWKSFTYFSHQEEGIEWMIDKEMHGTRVSNATVYGGFQCDDMGLGKTIQVVGTIVNHFKPTTLIVAPLAMVETWISICIRAGMRVYTFDSKWKCVTTGSFPFYFRKNRPSVYVTNYEKIIHNPSSFTAFDRIVLDEAHKIRNPFGSFAKSIQRIKAPIRWAVTGTPLVNSYRDVVSLLAFVGMPLPRTKTGKLFYGWSPSYLEVVLPQLLIHRSIESLRGIVADVPPMPKIIEEHLPFLTQKEEEFYTGVQCVDGYADDGYAMDIMTSIESFKLLLRLRQLSVHPQVYINAKRREDSTYDREDWTGPSTKFERIKKIIREDDKVHKYIIFCQFMEEMILLSKELSQYNVLQYNGSLTQKQRTEVLRKSKESTETTVLLIQLQAGGVGLNLQEYDRIIFVSPWWTSALMNQAIARAVRMGQKEVVRVYHLVLSQEWENKQITNIDNRIQQKADEKQRMLEKIFQMCALVQFDQ
jgi:SNF2 family DNA or RNA helicase